MPRRPETPEDPAANSYTPSYVFFYGSLASPSVLKEVLELDTEPVLIPASAANYQVKSGGRYPSLVPVGHSDASGMAYWVTKAEDLRRIRAYEGTNWRQKFCIIRFKGDSTRTGYSGLTFEWAGDQGASFDRTFHAP